MAKNVLNIGDASVDAELFAAYQKRAMGELKEEYDLKEKAKELAKDFKETVESCNLNTKLPKAELTKFFKARFEESLPKDDDDGKDVGTKVVISRGELYTKLNELLDGSDE